MSQTPYLAALAAFVVLRCHGAAITTTIPKDLRSSILADINDAFDDPARLRCRGRRQHDQRDPVCFCDESCHGYGDCCVDIARDEPRRRFMCAQLEYGGEYVWAKASCPKTRPDFRCERFLSNFTNLTYVVDVPVYHTPSRTLYRNIYCVLCNGGYLGDVYGWRSQLAWIDASPMVLSSEVLRKSVYDPHRRVYHVRQNGTVYRAAHRATQFKWENFSQAFNTRKCFPAVSTCPEGADPMLSRKCHLYAAYRRQNRTGTLYKNPHCASCNGVREIFTSRDGQDLQHGPPRVTVTRTSLAASTRPVVLSTPSMKPASGPSFQFIFDPKIADSGCGKNEVRVPGLNTCQPFSCPPGTRWKNGRGCVGPGSTNGCPWVVFEEKWVTILKNGSLFLNFSGEILQPGQYETESWTGHVRVCVSHPVTVVLDPIQEILAEVCLALSTVCLVLLVIVYALSPPLRVRPAGRALLCLSLSLATAQALFLVSNDLPPHTSACHIVAVVLHFGYLASFFWMNALAIDICRSLATHIFDSGSGRTFLWYSAYAWLGPAVLVGIALLVDALSPGAALSPHYGGHVCWICHRGALIAFFLVPVAALLVANAVLFAITARSLRLVRRKAAANRRESPSIPFVLYVKLVFAFGLTWVFGFAAALTPARFLWYPFIVLSGLQGAFLLVAFGCKKTVFYELKQRLFPRREKVHQEPSSGTTASTGFQPLIARRSTKEAAVETKKMLETTQL